MGLTNDIENALFKSMGEPEDKGNLPQLAVDIADAVINFLTKQSLKNKIFAYYYLLTNFNYQKKYFLSKTIIIF